MFILGNKVVLWFFCFVFNKQAFLKAEKGKAKQWKFTFHKRPFQRSASGRLESRARSRSAQRGSERRPFPGAQPGPGASRILGGSSSGAHRLPAPGLSITFCPSSFFPQPRPVLTSHLLSHGIWISHLKSGALCWVFKDSDL